MDLNYATIGRMQPTELGKFIDTFHVSFDPKFWNGLGGKAGYCQLLTTQRALQGLDTNWADNALWLNVSPQQLHLHHLARQAGVISGYTHVLGHRYNQTTSLGIKMDHLSAREFETNWPHLSKIILPMAQVMHAQFTKTHLVPFFGLTGRERDVLAHLALGFRPEEIASHLNVGYRAVDKNIVSAKTKLSAMTRDHAVARAISLGLLDIDTGRGDGV